ncbi:MAG: ABC transporter permease [Deferribacteraceae bacterium]|jgi:putative ABC transport system permease protein|nr:ABC transporter permease [Deferribacteraceae bacterium]
MNTAVFKLKRFLGTCKEALRATVSAPSRTILSAVCIGLGIAGVAIVAALSVAALKKAEYMIETFGSDTLFLVSGSNYNMPFSRQLTLSVGDADALRENFPDAYFVSPIRNVWGLIVSYQNARLMSEVGGLTGTLEIERNWKIVEGRDLTPDDREYANNVCLLGSFVRDTLFPNEEDPLGKQIKIGRGVCEVVGVAEEKTLGAYDNVLNTFVLLPDTVFSKRFQWRRLLAVGIRMRFYTMDDVNRQLPSVIEFLRERHGLEEGQPNDFRFFTASSISQMIYTIMGAIGAFLGAITLLVIIVGGFVTANIFLLATQTRVKEIGIRRAFGANSTDIFLQFIIEFVIVGLCGMLVGVLVGSAYAAFISSFGFLDVKITPTVFLITTFVSLIVALTFGILPARSASKINPIDAIKSL